MTIYKLDGSDKITEGVRICGMTSVYEDEVILEFVADDAANFRIGVNHEEATALIEKLAKGLSLLRGLAVR